MWLQIPVQYVWLDNIKNKTKLKLGSKYDLLDTPGILKYKLIYWSKYLQNLEQTYQMQLSENG